MSGKPSENNFTSHILPIFQTTAFIFKNVKEARNAFGDKSQLDSYSRISNPNHRELEKMLARLENGEAAQIFASGMAAINAFIISFLKSNDHLIVITPVYGGTYGACKKIWEKFGLDVSFIDINKAAEIEKNLKPETKAILLETPTNPDLSIIDISALAKKIKKYNKNILIAVDNTFATPHSQRPLLLGADLSIQSLTKYLGGHGDFLGGAIIGSRKHLKVIWEHYALLGAMMDAGVAWHLSRHLESFPERIKIHNLNAAIVAEFLEKHPKIEKVYYPGLVSHPQHQIAKKQMRDSSGKNAFGGMISFELKGSIKETIKFLDGIAHDSKSSIVLAVSLGTADTLIQSPAQMTHYRVPREERLRQGITDKLIRLSVGRSEVSEICKTLNRHLKKIKI